MIAIKRVAEIKLNHFSANSDISFMLSISTLLRVRLITEYIIKNYAI